MGCDNDKWGHPGPETSGTQHFVNLCQVFETAGGDSDAEVLTELLLVALVRGSASTARCSVTFRRPGCENGILTCMDPGDIREFVGRGWDQKDALKRQYWAERYRLEGPRATLAASSALREHFKTLRPDWPTAADRAADLRRHLALIAKLDRVARAFANR